MKYRIVNLFAFLVMITMNALANILPINGKKTGELSDQYSNLFVPAGITFSIWGVIYILLLSVIVLQFLLRWRDEVEGLRWSIVANFLLNALWIVVWHYEYVFLSLLVMVALLATLLIINRDSMRRGSWIVRLAFGVYMGWICLATIANTTALLVGIGWDGLGITQETWTIFMILVGAGVGVTVIWQLQNPFIALALIWGFYGIVLKRQLDYPSIVTASYVGIALTITVSLYRVFKSRMAADGKTSV